MRSGEYIGALVLLNTDTKFAKLQVGKYVVTTRQRSNPGDRLFPLAIALSGLYPISKVWVNYEPQPKNIFTIRVNDGVSEDVEMAERDTINAPLTSDKGKVNKPLAPATTLPE